MKPEADTRVLLRLRRAFAMEVTVNLRSDRSKSAIPWRGKTLTLAAVGLQINVFTGYHNDVHIPPFLSRRSDL